MFVPRLLAPRFARAPSTWWCRAFASTPGSETSQKPVRKRLDVAIVGAPNAGKSQLLNVLTKAPVAAVSRKRHTTRSDILGVRTIEDTQLVFKDTPGYLRVDDAKSERLDRDLIITAAAEMQHVDYTLLVIDSARTLTDNYRHALVQLIMNAMRSQGRIEEEYDDQDDAEENKDATAVEENPSKFAIVLNKVDLVKPKKKLLELAFEIGDIADACLADEHGEELGFEALLEMAPICFYVSALEEDGTEEIVEHLQSLATPCQTWAVPAGHSTTMSSEEQVQELIREKIYRCLHQELPHSVQQVNRMFRRVPQGVIIHQDLVVFKKSHQKLVLGTGGRTLQRIQDSATRDLAALFGSEVVLRLHVKLSKSKQRPNPGEYSLGNVDQSVH